MKYLILLLSLLFCSLAYSQGTETTQQKFLETEKQLTDLVSQLIDSTLVKRMTYGEWSSETDYYMGDLIFYKNKAYESLADDNKEIPLNSKLWKSVPDKFISVEGITINFKFPWLSDSIYAKIKRKFPYAIDSSGRLKTAAPLVNFINCTFNQLPINDLAIADGVSFSGCTIGSLDIKNICTPSLSIQNSTIRSINILDSKLNTLYITGLEAPELRADEHPDMYLHNSIINSARITYTPDKLSLWIHECKFPGDTTFYAYEKNNRNHEVFTFGGIVNNTSVSSLMILNSSFGSPGDSSSVLLKANFSTVEIDKTLFHSNVNLFSIIEERIYLTGNTFQGLFSINNVTLPVDFKIRWNQLSGRKIAKLNDTQVYDQSTGSYRLEQYVKASNGEGISNIDHYEDIMHSYQTLYTFYKNAGDLESANGCFSEMKDVQTERYAYLFSHEKTFKSFFRWKLAQLMKFYTSHGTDPARAIVISMWVMLAFAVFYFFFPSDWDVTSKSKLFSNYKDFIEKNEKGYIKPFFVLALGFSVSLLNAFTLSVNSFTTLGFGNIPTHGIAKYFCVLEGFIGWFLLSIFTVALINQVLG